MSLSKEELVLTACFLKSTDMSISIEDALDEEDWEGWQKLTKELGIAACWRRPHVYCLRRTACLRETR